MFYRTKVQQLTPALVWAESLLVRFNFSPLLLLELYDHRL